MSDRKPTNTGRTDTVVLLHGLGGKDWNLRYLGRRLDRAGLARPHDGWVQVSETRIEGARLVTSRAFHFGLLFSRNVADLLCAFFSGEI